jgi:hypothetical protein
MGNTHPIPAPTILRCRPGTWKIDKRQRPVPPATPFSERDHSVSRDPVTPIGPFYTSERD